MAKKLRVKINRFEFGRQVTGSPEMSAQVAGYANQVAARVGGEVEMKRFHVRGGGARAVARISDGSSDADEAKTGRLLSALMSVGSKR